MGVVQKNEFFALHLFLAGPKVKNLDFVEVRHEDTEKMALYTAGCSRCVRCGHNSLFFR